jgi:hypothetical protein
MERHDEGLTTRDLAGTAAAESRPAPADARPADEVPPDERPAGAGDGAAEGRASATAAPEAGERPASATAAPDTGAAVQAHDEPRAGGAPRSPADEDIELLPATDRDDFGREWEEIQTGFVDEPRQTVERADALVATVMQRLADGFASERDRLEQHWDRGEDISTEDLRIALQRYRSFFRRLLSA